MVIDLESFQDISVDSNGVARVGAGVRLGNLALGILIKRNVRYRTAHALVLASVAILPTGDTATTHEYGDWHWIPSSVWM